jgi:hypothetical protein
MYHMGRPEGGSRRTTPDEPAQEAAETDIAQFRIRSRQKR